jgi:hypothetical protein
MAMARRSLRFVFMMIDCWNDDVSMSFGEAYMNGQFEVEGDLADLVALALNSGLLSASVNAQGLTSTVLRAAVGARTLKRSREDIAYSLRSRQRVFSLWLEAAANFL